MTQCCCSHHFGGLEASPGSAPCIATWGCASGANLPLVTHRRIDYASIGSARSVPSSRQPVTLPQTTPVARERPVKPVNDPWPAFTQRYLFSLMRNLVSYRGTVSAQEYVRIEGLLSRFVERGTRRLKRAVLMDVLERWQESRHLGHRLEDAFAEVLDELLTDGERLPAPVADWRDQSPAQSGQRPSVRPPVPATQPEQEEPKLNPVCISRGSRGRETA